MSASPSGVRISLTPPARESAAPPSAPTSGKESDGPPPMAFPKLSTRAFNLYYGPAQALKGSTFVAVPCITVSVLCPSSATFRSISASRAEATEAGVSTSS